MKAHLTPARWAALFCTVLFVLTSCASKRVAPPPAGKTFQVPWGAVPLERWDPTVEKTFERDLIEGAKIRLRELRKEAGGKPITVRGLALSGGGSHGAYGAGVLIGWTDAGTRPEFDVVTGISTGALTATAVFLGPEYDDTLRMYTRVTNRDIFKPRGLLAVLTEDSMYSAEPLRALIAKEIDEGVLQAVAREHARGRRLFIGTVNLDAQAFTIWDMGLIASSDRPDRLERYRDVILASASVPVLFPPVYIPVEVDGESYRQMHVDGGAREMIFYPEFIQDFDKAIAEAGLSRSEVRAEIYVLYNGRAAARGTYEPLPPRALSVMEEFVRTLMRKNTTSSIYQIWVRGLIHNMDIHLTDIPPEYKDLQNDMEFNPDDMKRLFEYGYNRSVNGEAWWTQPAVENYQELIRRINPAEVIGEMEARPELRRLEMWRPKE
ncbi:MAG: patatin-like phospholipase family protein [Syntrophobacterales bacterium]